EDIDAGVEAWDVTDPDRFDNEDLIEREASMGRSNFMLQFMLDTTLSDAGRRRLGKRRATRRNRRRIPLRRQRAIVS
ncbi:MAG: hypothetical protein EBT12_16995, partial [Marivivens sp.]|nr:hypothetical protein [Marivivens sp.]